MIVIAKPRRRVYLHELEDQLDCLENQQPKPRTGWLRGKFCVLLSLFGICVVAVWYCSPSMAAVVFIVLGAPLLFMAGDTFGRLGAAREIEDTGF